MCGSSCSNNNNSCQANRNSTNSNFNGIIYTTNGTNGLAQSYVPNQVLGIPFSAMQGLQNGTMFPELVRPYYPGDSLEQMNYLRYGRGGCNN